MLDKSVVEKLHERYADLHPLIFKRSVEKAKTNGELFDILEDVPKSFPIKWCEETRRWIYFRSFFEIDSFLEKCQNKIKKGEI